MDDIYLAQIPAGEEIFSAVTATGALTTLWFVTASQTVWTELTNQRAALPLLRYRHLPARSILFLPVTLSKLRQERERENIPYVMYSCFVLKFHLFQEFATLMSFRVLIIPASLGPGCVTGTMIVETAVMRGIVEAHKVLLCYQHCHPDAEVLAHKQA